MRFSIIAASFLATLVIATPVPKKSSKTTTSSAVASATGTAVVAASAASSTSSASGAALVASAYNDFQISSGTAGTGEAEANALFTSIDQTNLAGVSAADLKVIKGIHDAAEDAETDAFNPAIAAASGDAATALQNGKIKNKILKLTAEVLADNIEAAQGDTAAATDATAEQVKLTNNIKLDTAAAGQASTAVPFTATS